jgi:hypothetical protein
MAKKNKKTKSSKKIFVSHKYLFLTFVFILFALVLLVANISKNQEIRKRASDLLPLDDSSCLPQIVSEAFNDTLNISFWDEWKSANGTIEVSTGLLKTQVPGNGFAGIITKTKACGNFETQVNFSSFFATPKTEGNARLSLIEETTNSEMFVEYYQREGSSGFRTNLVKNSTPLGEKTVQKVASSALLKIIRESATFSAYYDTGEGWTLLGDYSSGFETPIKIGLVVKSYENNPSVSANFDNFSYRRNISFPRFTPIPQSSPTPTGLPSPTPTISLTPTITITTTPSVTPTTTPITSPSATPTPTLSTTLTPTLTLTPTPIPAVKIRFKAKLSATQTNPDLYFKLRIKDEIKLMESQKNYRSTDFVMCYNPPDGIKDYFIPVKADGSGTYTPAEKISPVPPSTSSVPPVSSEGWISLDILQVNKYYTLILKGPKTRGSKMLEHATFKLEGNNSYDFDWTNSPLEPGDLPNVENSGKQDCMVNSLDISLIISRLGKTDSESLNLADVNYDGVVNGNDLAKVLATLSSKTDDD